MGTYKIPTSVPKTYRYLLTDLLGVDYNDTVADNRRSPRMENLVNNNGFLETRKGTRILGYGFGNRINGIWNWDGKIGKDFVPELADGNWGWMGLDTSTGQVDDDYDKIHTGDIAVRPNTTYSITFENITVDVVGYGTSGFILNGLETISSTTTSKVIKTGANVTKIALSVSGTMLIPAYPSGSNLKITQDDNLQYTEVIIVHAGTNLYRVGSDWTTHTLIKEELNDIKSSGITYKGKLFIFDGKRALVFDEKGINYLDDRASEDAIPIVQIGTKPNGTGGTVLQKPNLLTHYMTVQFCADGSSTKYVLPWKKLLNDDTHHTTIKKVNNDGTISLVTTGYTVDATKGEITFSTAPAKHETEGMDNIYITFYADDYEDTTANVENIIHTDYINKCTIATMFGYGGNNNRLFVSGNPDEPNGDWFSYVEQPFNFPEENWTKMGDSPVVGYSRAADGTLVVHKKLTDTDATVYYRTYNTVNGKDIFPVKTGVKNIGCLNDKCCQNFLNDPLFLSENGIYSIINENSTTDTKYAEDRSYYIKSKLLEEDSLEDAVATVNGTRYYLAVNTHVYVADKRFLSTSQYAGSNYQYEWFYFTDMPVRVWFNWNNEMYWGDNNGYIHTWSDDYNDEKWTTQGTTPTKIPIKVYWESEPLFLNDYAQAKTVRKLYVHHNPIGSSRIKLGYKDNDGEHEISTSVYTGTEVYPRVIQEKEKISKIMWFKPTIQNDEASRCSFNSIVVEYRIAGKYRGD